MKSKLSLLSILKIILVLSMINIAKVNANDVQVANVTRSGSTVSFDLSWNNSWRTSPQLDAVWIFIKYRTPICNPNEWIPFEHALLDENMAHHTFNSPLEAVKNIDSSPDNTGVLITRDHSGTGNIAATNITLTLLSPFPSTGNLEIRVFAIEMVKVAHGAYYIGDGSTGAGTLSSKDHFYDGSSISTPFLVNSNTIAVGSSSGQLNAAGNAPASSIPGPYPKGYNNIFYCMKTEISQQQYVDFLNTIKFSEAAVRYQAGPDVTYTLGGTWPYYNSGGFPERACADLSYKDLAAYLDWAALRPMTELEFEKVCRGPSSVSAVANEYAWGNTTLTAVGTRITPSCETVSNAGATGICNYAGGTSYGTLRPGFLGTSTSTRTTISAGYYGTLEMSGNLWEQVINVTTAGLAYRGDFGNGYLTNGEADVAYWPTGSTGYGYRGGAWFGNEPYLRTSARDLIVFTNLRYSNGGGRGCR